MTKAITRRLALLTGTSTVAALACSDSETTTDGSGGSGNAGAGASGGSTSPTTVGPGAGGNGVGAGPGVGGAGVGGSAGSCGAALLVMGSNYNSDPHDLMIPVADLTAGVERTYVSTPGGGGHTHEVTLTAADFTALQNGETVTKYSCRTPPNQTDHEWAISCANPTVQPVLEGEFGTEADCPST